MKKLLFSIALVLGVISNSHSNMQKNGLGRPNEHVSEAVYQSTTANVITTPNYVAITTYTSEIHTINISSAGSNDSSLWIYDSKTNNLGNAELIDVISGAQVKSNLYDVYCDSGIVIISSGSVSPRWNMTFRIK